MGSVPSHWVIPETFVLTGLATFLCWLPLPTSGTARHLAYFEARSFGHPPGSSVVTEREEDINEGGPKICESMASFPGRDAGITRSQQRASFTSSFVQSSIHIFVAILVANLTSLDREIDANLFIRARWYGAEHDARGWPKC